MNRIHTSFVLRMGAIVGMIIMMTSGLAFAEDVPEGQECCACAQDETAFDEMITEACQNGYSEKGIENPTEEQMNDCITRTKAQILENCPEEGTRSATGDSDGDGVPDNQDNCPHVPNPLQVRTDPNVKFTGDFPDMCRFIDNADGTVTDYKNRLAWLKEPPRQTMWKTEASNYCSLLGIAGGEWRLPEENEFRGLVEAGLTGSPFVYYAENYYWTSSTVRGDGTWGMAHPVVCNSSGQCPRHGDRPHGVWPVRNM